MKKILPFALLPLLTLPVLAQEAPASPTPAARDEATAEPKTEPKAESTDAAKDEAKGETAAPAKPRERPERGERRGRFGSEEDEKAFYKQLVDETPELKGVDTSTPEGKKKVKEILEAKHKNGEMPEIGIMMKVMRTKNHARLRQLFDMPHEDFTAIEPILARVEQLRAQKLFADIPTMVKGLGVDQMGGAAAQAQAQQEAFNTFIKSLMGNAVDPTVKECQDAAHALKEILADAQANPAEKSAAVARVRKARAGYLAALEKAQLELRGVLTAQQEAQLVDYGILD